MIRKRIKLSPEKAIFIFVDEVLPPTAALMSSIYEEHKDEDGFLYITYVLYVFVRIGGKIADVMCVADTLARTLSAKKLRQEGMDRCGQREALCYAKVTMEEGLNGRLGKTME